MTVKRSKCGTYWQVRVKPHGHTGRDIQRRVKTKAEGLRLEKEILAKYQDPQADHTRDNRTLIDLIELEHSIHGKNLADGEMRRNKLIAIAKRIGNPYAHKLNAATFASYRQERIAKGIKEATANREHSYLRSVYNRLIRQGLYKGSNPLAQIEQIKVQASELAWLDKPQRQRLLQVCKRSKSADLLPVVLICLSTGCRWDEAVSLTASRIKDNMIQFINTKNKKARFVDITDDLQHYLLNLPSKASGGLFRDPVRAFKTAVRDAKIELPAGQLTHVLRRTFAVNYMQQDGNIRQLQLLLGHGTLAMTEVYLRFAPIKQDSAQTLNPITTDGTILG